MTRPRTPFELAILRARQLEDSRHHDKKPAALARRLGSRAGAMPALEALQDIAGAGRCMRSVNNYSLSRNWVEPECDHDLRSSPSDEGLQHTAPSAPELTTRELDAAFHALKADLTSGKLSRGEKRRKRYVDYVKPFHPDLVPSQLQRHACMRLAEINQIMKTLDAQDRFQD